MTLEGNKNRAAGVHQAPQPGGSRSPRGSVHGAPDPRGRRALWPRRAAGLDPWPHPPLQVSPWRLLGPRFAGAWVALASAAWAGALGPRGPEGPAVLLCRGVALDLPLAAACPRPTPSRDVAGGLVLLSGFAFRSGLQAGSGRPPGAPCLWGNKAAFSLSSLE